MGRRMNLIGVDWTKEITVDYFADAEKVKWVGDIIGDFIDVAIQKQPHAS